MGKAIRLITGQELVRMVRAAQGHAAITPPAPVGVEPVFAPQAVTEVSAAVPPPRPTCSAAMARRTNRQTAAAFWGCTNFPRCRGTAKHASGKTDVRGGPGFPRRT
ncbi:hypothetical protein GCM10008101_13290 [Lysobacter xinjiangensis]|uniref:Topoisomerase DNA binding C4 zinc finger n=1 Tax=Cognatilysobacter xinjiangensis TaxID=546892 RepID=A0ABQ3C170_9GAMM|nr:topoisomerase DNA-binding C4 zinc finger domain-containing protein [Lysobacter xinjiangensis]GGZ60661.1 hypothetical protein GCM10008101_13290 [Lysobacter xinjiangensis]